MKKNKFSIGRLFYNDKFVMIFSVLVSIILWFTVSATNTSTESHKVISDIPVTIELSQNAKDNDLMVFNDNQTASVSVSGSSFIVSQLLFRPGRSTERGPIPWCSRRNSKAP